MSDGGKKLAAVLEELLALCQPGVSAQDIDKKAEKLLRQTGGEPTFKGFQDYPASICISMNSEVVHGQPTGKKIFQEGDIVTVDIGLTYKGFVTDMARTIAIGDITPQARELIRVTRESLDIAIEKAVIGNRVGDISAAVQKHVEAAGFGVVRSLVGHGVGKNMHEDPRIPNYGSAHTGSNLAQGLTIAIEPMVTAGRYDVFTEEDGWTVKTQDGSLAAHFEDSIAVMANGPLILTRLS